MFDSMLDIKVSSHTTIEAELNNRSIEALYHHLSVCCGENILVSLMAYITCCFSSLFSFFSWGWGVGAVHSVLNACCDSTSVPS